MAFAAPSAGAAYAVPTELNIETSGGSPTTIGAPVAVRPFNKDRREILTRFVITCDMSSPFWLREFPQTHQRHDQLFELKLRALKIVQCLADERAIRRSLHPPRCVS